MASFGKNAFRVGLCAVAHAEVRLGADQRDGAPGFALGKWLRFVKRLSSRCTSGPPVRGPACECAGSPQVGLARYSAWRAVGESAGPGDQALSGRSGEKRPRRHEATKGSFTFRGRSIRKTSKDRLRERGTEFRASSAREGAGD